MTRRRCECEKCLNIATKTVNGVLVCPRHEDEVAVNLEFLNHQDATGLFVYRKREQAVAVRMAA